MADTDKVAGESPSRDESASAYQSLPPHHGMSPGEYLATRISSLKPPMLKAPNPIRLIMLVKGRQWAFFFVAFIAWVSF